MENEHNIDGYFKRSLENFEVQPKMHSFDRVMKKMEQRKKRRLFFILFWPGITLFLATCFWFIYPSSPKPLKVHNSTPAENASGLSQIQSNGLQKQEIKNKARNTVTRPGKNIDKVRASSTPPGAAIPAKINLGATQPAPALSQVAIKAKVNAVPVQHKNFTRPAVFKNNLFPDTIRASGQNAKQANKLQPVIITRQPVATQHWDTTAIEGTIFVQPLSIFINDTAQREAVLKINVPADNLGFGKPDSLKKKNERIIRFCIGPSINLQAGSFLFSDNAQKKAVYNNSPYPFSSAYIQDRKKQNAFHFNRAYGLKLGLNFYDKYELLLGFGYQYYQYNEEQNLTPSTFGSNAFVWPAGNYNKSRFTYQYYMLEGSRIFGKGSFLKIKAGLGLQANRIRFADYIYAPAPGIFYYEQSAKTGLAPWMYTVNLKSGVILDLSKRLQFQMCPAVFYSPSSMFGKDYAIKQKTFGFELQCQLLFKLFKIKVKEPQYTPGFKQ